jgi:endonuclease YncB( thermonuclease family)
MFTFEVHHFGMNDVTPFRELSGKPSKWRRRRTKQGDFTLSGVTIFNLAMLMFLAVLLWPNAAPPFPDMQSLAAASGGDPELAHFGYCHEGGGRNCVVDGDTFYYSGQKIRIADIDTPETHPPRCTREAELGAAATQRLQALLNAGPFSLQPIDRDEDVHGRKLRIIVRGGHSIGAQLVSEGLARYYGNGRQPWC